MKHLLIKCMVTRELTNESKNGPAPAPAQKLSLCRYLMLTRVTQKPKMQLSDLFAQFGGYLGLFTGVSIITFCEFIEVIFKICSSCLGKFRKIHPHSA